MKLALGTVQFGMDYGVANPTGRVLQEEAWSILQHARQSGIDTLDTAIAYGDSESVLGTLEIQSWKVITKLPGIPNGCSDVHQWVCEQVHGSLTRLKVNRLYGLLLHRPADLLGSMGTALVSALRSLKSEGWVHKTGISVYGPSELDLLSDECVFDLVQAPLNIVDRRMLDSGWADKLRHLGTELHTRSAFLQGLLLMPPQARPDKFNQWRQLWHEWDRWLEETGLSPLQACVRYVNGLDCIDRVVVGIDSVNQLDQIIEAAHGEIPGLPFFENLQDDRLINPASWNQL